MNSVVRLSNQTHEGIRSLQTISRASQAVEECVLNSVDAEATSIRVNTCLPKSRFAVSDKGCGIKAEELGLVGVRHSTSKCGSLEDLQAAAGRSYGFRGEALASLGTNVIAHTLMSGRSKLEPACLLKGCDEVW